MIFSLYIYTAVLVDAYIFVSLFYSILSTFFNFYHTEGESYILFIVTIPIVNLKYPIIFNPYNFSIM